MKKIVLNVSDESFNTVMNIVTNLKTGLIESIDGENGKPLRKGAYVPKSGEIVSENKKPAGKYVSPSAYKNRLKKK